ncbi:MAG: NADP-specific glutamate dehydrogenase [Phycisphaeraceae bacterium]|nr:MAG: NADP-specific glutamate dehydrogenase [Phycisphaeraceae bacterium]
MSYVRDFLGWAKEKNPNEPEFLQAVTEVAETLEPVFERHPEWAEDRVLERLSEPERAVSFRVSWLDDSQRVRVNRGYRVQFSSAIGPYKGGMRFHPTVNLSVLKFLGFEQIFKNSLTGQAIGGGKGGSDFDPKGKSESEVMRFCQALMCELWRHLGPDTDVPAGDIGVGSREVGFMYGMDKKLRNAWTGVFTGKDPASGGSLIRPEATGYGVVYFASEMMEAHGESLEGKRCVVSGSGNVAQYTVEKLIEIGAKPVTMSDSGGFIHDPDGITREKLDWVKELKNERRGRISEYAEKYKGMEYTETGGDSGVTGPWELECYGVFPCATQNELDEKSAKRMVESGVRLVAEGANMPSTNEAIKVMQDAGVLFGPAKAANAGGVAVSALEMAQNSQRQAWTREVVDARLQDIMKRIFGACCEAAEKYGKKEDYLSGANIAGFEKVAQAMRFQGVL